MDEVHFLSVDDVLQIHDEAIRVEGGSAGLRDLGLLESAVAMPRQQFGGEYLHRTLAEMAAAYLFHLASNHAFVDGNKRVGVMAAYVFLDANGVELQVSPRELEKITLSVAAGQSNKDDVIAFFHKHVPSK